MIKDYNINDKIIQMQIKVNCLKRTKKNCLVHADFFEGHH